LWVLFLRQTKSFVNMKIQWALPEACFNAVVLMVALIAILRHAQISDIDSKL
jgi:hypothetical protein